MIDIKTSRGQDMYLIGRVGEDGNINGYVSTGRPSTYRVLTSLDSCKRCMAQFGGKLVPVRLLTGERVQLDKEVGE